MSVFLKDRLPAVVVGVEVPLGREGFLICDTQDETVIRELVDSVHHQKAMLVWGMVW